MNWKKFMVEFQLIKAWLEEQQYMGINELLLKIILLAMLKKTDDPELIISKAVANVTLTELFYCQDNYQQQAIEIPEKVYAVIDKWLKCLPPEAEILGVVYESMAAGRRTKGLYYTPKGIINFILNNTVAKCDVAVNPKVKILDPACGCGYFLLTAYDLLWHKYSAARSVLSEKYPEADWSDDGIHRHILQYNLWGADIDSMAAEVAVAALMFKRPKANDNLKINIICGDSLKSDAFANATLAKAFWQAGYDFVVGNPPYLSFGLRGTTRLAPEYEDYLRREYSECAQYKLSYYVLFMQKGLDMLVQGGKLGFIVPDSFLLGRYYSKIRKYIMDNAAIEIFAHVSSAVFKNASPGFSVICVLAKEGKPAVRTDQQVSIYQIENSQDVDKAIPSCRYQQSYFATLPHQRFRIFFDRMSRHIVDKIDAIGLPLGKFLAGHSGIRSLSRQSDIIASLPQGDTWQRGLISGRQVLRYGLLDEGHWLNIDPKVLYKGGWYPEHVKVRKILMRQTGDTLTACIDQNGFYHLNNIHSFVAQEDSVTLDYLLMILNSRLLGFYYHVVSMEYGRSMAQTDIETIELLPICINYQINKQAPEMVKTMESCVIQTSKGDPAAAKKAQTLDAYLDQLVYRIYCLTDDEISYIENYEAKLCAKRQTRFKSKLK